jgi:hypothetical protein
MLPSHRTLALFYGAIAVLALVTTWIHNFFYLQLGFVAGNLAFWRETLATHASASVAIDLFCVGMAVVVWMLFEARRIGLRFVWLYVFAGFTVALSVAVAMFLCRREFLLAARQESGGPGVTGADVAGLVAVTLISLAYIGWTFGTRT